MREFVPHRSGSTRTHTKLAGGSKVRRARWWQQSWTKVRRARGSGTRMQMVRCGLRSIRTDTLFHCSRESLVTWVGTMQAYESDATITQVRTRPVTHTHRLVHTTQTTHTHLHPHRGCQTYTGTYYTNHPHSSPPTPRLPNLLVSTATRSDLCFRNWTRMY